MYVCICNAVTERQIAEAVAAGARTLADLRRDLGVSGGCGCCAAHAQRTLEHAREERRKLAKAEHQPGSSST